MGYMRAGDVEKSGSHRFPNIRALSKQQRNLGGLQCRKDRLEFMFAASSPHQRYRLLVRFLLGRNERYVAITAPRKAITKFGFAKRTKHRC
jgi:hypothetical protein